MIPIHCSCHCLRLLRGPSLQHRLLPQGSPRRGPPCLAAWLAVVGGKELCCHERTANLLPSNKSMSLVSCSVHPLGVLHPRNIILVSKKVSRGIFFPVCFVVKEDIEGGGSRYQRARGTQAHALLRLSSLQLRPLLYVIPSLQLQRLGRKPLQVSIIQSITITRLVKKIKTIMSCYIPSRMVKIKQ